MRDIKFRVWDNLTKKWIKYKMICAHANTTDGNISFIQHPQGYTFQQFTGLLDSKDKEIYEGDIVKFENKNHLIKYIRGRWVINIPGQYSEGYELWIHTRCCEIIGNIFGTPELIK